MSAVGHFLEEEGLATVSITLVRPHVAAIGPPRSLWVPFELGRPLGAPNDPAFQRRVLMAALGLLESDDGPVLLADYPEDAPGGSRSLEGWACPVVLKAPPEAEGDRFKAAVVEEILSLRPWHDIAAKDRGRTTVGVTGVDIVDAARFLASYVDTGEPEPSYRPDLSVADALKLATEDVKAFYLEAATAQPGTATSAELTDWFWGETTAGKILLGLKQVCAGIDDPVAKAMAAFALVPRSQLHRLPPDAR